MSTYNLTVNVSAADGLGDNIPNSALSVGAESIEKIATTLTSLQVDKQIDLSFKFANLKGFFLLSTKGGTLETNTTNHSGGDIITFIANVPYVWLTGISSGSNPFANDVTTAYLTGTDSGAAAVKIWVLHDPAL